MAAVVLQVIPSFFAGHSQMFFVVCADTYKKNIVCIDSCVASHTDKTCFVSNCQFHIILLGNVEELLKKLDTICFTCQLVDCLYTLFKYRFSGKVIAKSEQKFDNVRPAADVNHRNKGVDRTPRIARKILAEKVQKTFNQLLSEDKNNAH